MPDWSRKTLLKRAALHMRQKLSNQELARQVQFLEAVGHTRQTTLKDCPVRVGALDKHEARYVAQLLRKGALYA